MNEWINVDEELPEEYEDVLCYSKKNGGYFFIGYVNANGDWHKSGMLHCYDVTHWTPLIEPRRGE